MHQFRQNFVGVFVCVIFIVSATSGSLHQVRASPQATPRAYLPGNLLAVSKPRFCACAKHCSRTKHHGCVNAAASAVAAAAEEIKRDQKHCRLYYSNEVMKSVSQGFHCTIALFILMYLVRYFFILGFMCSTS